MIKLIIKYLLIFLLLCIIGNVSVYFLEPGFILTPALLLQNCVTSILIGFPIMKANELALSYISKKIEWKDKPLKKLIISFITIILVSTLGLVIIDLFFRIVTGKGFIFPNSHSAFNLLSFQVIFLIYVFTIVTGLEFFQMWKEGLIKQESLQRKTVELQLEAIKNQVNPHFLFNSLNCLSSLVHKDQDLAVEFIEKLSDIYRYVLEQKNKKTIAWKNEKQFLENYLELMKIRFSENLNYRITIDENEKIQVVPLSVQILVENAIKHNVISDEKALFIEVFKEEDYIVIRNNLQPKKIIEESHNIGLENIRLQYEIISRRKVQTTNMDGCFTVKLPIIC